MKAKIIGFKGSRRDTYNNCCILEVKDKNPPALIGKKVFWKTASGRAIQGKIIHTHGKSALLARFRKGIPGFALGDELEFKAPALPRLKKIKKVKRPKVEVKKPKVPEKKKPAPKEKAPVAKPAKKKAEEKKKPAPKKKKAEAKKKPAQKKKAPAKKKPAAKKKLAKKAPK